MQNSCSHNVRFSVTVSNGEVFYEGAGILEEVLGEISPWQKLHKYLINNKLYITSLSLHTDQSTYHLPSPLKASNFGSFREAKNPIDYDLKRSIGREKTMTRPEKGEFSEGDVVVKEWFTVGVAIYDAYDLEIWVDEFGKDKGIDACFTVIVPHKLN